MVKMSRTHSRPEEVSPTVAKISSNTRPPPPLYTAIFFLTAIYFFLPQYQGQQERAEGRFCPRRRLPCTPTPLRSLKFFWKGEKYGFKERQGEHKTDGEDRE